MPKVEKKPVGDRLCKALGWKFRDGGWWMGPGIPAPLSSCPFPPYLFDPIESVLSQLSKWSLVTIERWGGGVYHAVLSRGNPADHDEYAHVRFAAEGRWNAFAEAVLLAVETENFRKKKNGTNICPACGGVRFRYVGLPARRFPCPNCHGSGTVEKEKP